jgi:hypothetical protein
MDEEMVCQVASWETSTLSERHKVAMALTDAFVIGYGRVPEELAATARAAFRREELLEIGVVVFRSSHNKISIALGTDTENLPITLM